MTEEIEAIMKYFGLENPDDARKAQWILDELKVYGDWGNKVASYFSALISGTPGTKTFIDPSKVEAYKSLFSDYGRKL